MKTIRGIVVCMSALGLLAFAWTPAAGDPSQFHFMKIVEVFPGTVAKPNAQYVILQAYAPNQNVVINHRLYFFDSAGVKIDSAEFFTDVSNAADQMFVMLSTPQAESLFQIVNNRDMPAKILPAGGKVCWDVTNVDCFCWGDYTGPSTGVGTPFQAELGLLPGKAAVRRLDVVGSPTHLDNADDTQDSENDFEPGPPVPHNNQGGVGVTPSSTCGNNVIEGLEQCDDGNTMPNDGCNSVCDEEYCGDGVTQSGEECDDGNFISGDGCDPVCLFECGNGVVDAGETCDDGNTIPGDGCDATCQTEIVCGNGIVQAGEGCDDGNTTPGDGCDALCQVECPVTLTGDVNVSGTLTSADIISLVNHVFKAGAAPQPCSASGDVNCSGGLTSSDIIGLVNHVFKGGAAPCDVCTLIPGTWSCP